MKVVTHKTRELQTTDKRTLTWNVDGHFGAPSQADISRQRSEK